MGLLLVFGPHLAEVLCLVSGEILPLTLTLLSMVLQLLQLRICDLHLLQRLGIFGPRFSKVDLGFLRPLRVYLRRYDDLEALHSLKDLCTKLLICICLTSTLLYLRHLMTRPTGLTVRTLNCRPCPAVLLSTWRSLALLFLVPFPHTGLYLSRDFIQFLERLLVIGGICFIVL